MNVFTSVIDPWLRRPLVWRIGLGLALVVALWQLPFFIGGHPERLASQLLYYGYILAWMLVVTAFTRTVSLRTIAAFFLVGLFAVMAVDLLIARPMHKLVGGGALASGYLGPLIEELVKPLPILAIFAYRAWRRAWTLGASDGLLLGFVVGAGFAIHEDAMYGRIWGEGFGGGWSMLFPSIADFRGATLPYHDVMSAAVGLALGVAFVYRRYRAAWAVPAVVWVLVLMEHVTGNLRDISGGASGWAKFVRGLMQEGELILPVLVVGIVAAIVLEWRILRSIEREDGLFPKVALGAFASALRGGGMAGLRRLARLFAYAYGRHSVYYTVWSDPATPSAQRSTMAASLYVAGLEAGVPVDRTFAEYDGLAEPAASAPSAAPSAAPGS